MHLRYFCFISGYKARLGNKAEVSNVNIHRKLRVATSEREGKLSNPRGRAARTRDAWRKFTEILRNPARKRRARDMQ
jgi:hypothetical protein